MLRGRCGAAVLTASRSAPGEPFDPEAALHGAAVEVRSAPGAPWKEALAASSAPLRAKLAPDRARPASHGDHGRRLRGCAPRYLAAPL
jgi:hypothetical protein